MPFLFQTIHSGARRGMSSATIWRIHRAALQLAETNPGLRRREVRPHDFRRLLATELVNNGLPIHIGAALLGHLNIQTTRGYVAVFDENVITHYQQFLDRRRAARPDGEYREPTTDEWASFQEHFDKRRVELGSCGRPYGTPCAHERVPPRRTRGGPAARRRRAIEKGWHGEVEDLDLTLAFLRSKRNQTQRVQRAGTVNLGLPALPHQRPALTTG